jgi:endonuclease/exonuclease/phosphatase (EEP) superfamily protein YafD
MRWFDRLLIACAVLVVLASLLPLGARLSWLLELTTHFRLQYLAATLVLLPLLALRRRWGACAVLIATGAVSAAPVVPYLPLREPAQPAVAAIPLELMTVNVSYQQFSAPRLLQIVREASPDVVVVQELTPHAERVLADLDTLFPHGLKFPAEGPYGIGLWSRFELESGVTFALGRVPALEARVLSPAGVFTIIGAHLSAPTAPLRAAARNQQLRELGARSAAISGPLVVAGDFNVTPYSPYFLEWLDASGLTDTRRGRTLSVSWSTKLPIMGVPIDHVAVSSDFEILAHRVLPHFGSDHYGVLVEVALRGAATESP